MISLAVLVSNYGREVSRARVVPGKARVLQIFFWVSERVIKFHFFTYLWLVADLDSVIKRIGDALCLVITLEAFVVGSNLSHQKLDVYTDP